MPVKSLLQCLHLYYLY